MNFKYIFFCLFFFACFGFLNAQKIEISGKVIDSQNKKPIEFASISLLNSIDKSVVSNEVSDKKGNFLLLNQKPGKYQIKIEFVGYETEICQNFILEYNQNKNLGSITLEPKSQILNEVLIAGKTKNSNNLIDKQQYKASQFETAKGGSAMDVIKNLPSVTVNSEGQISLRGSNGFMVLVNGKPVLTDATTVLSQLPANTIQNIELITAPTAKHDPDGKAGIINIVTSKPTTTGFAFSINSNAGLPSTNDYDNLEVPQRFGTDISGNFRNEKIDFSTTLNYQRNDINGFRDGDVFTKNLVLNTKTQFPSNGERSFDRKNYSVKTALLFTPNKSNSFQFGIFLGQKFQARRADINYSTTVSDIPTNNILKQFAYFNSNVQTKEGTFALANFDYTHNFQNKSNLGFSTLLENANLYGNTINLNSNFGNNNDIFQEIQNPYSNPIFGFRAKIYYTFLIGKGKFETGYQYRNDCQEGTFDYKIQPESIPAIDNSQFRGTAKTKNNIHAIYSQYAAESAKLNYVLGLRYENAKRNVKLSSENHPHILEFNNLFPSTNLVYTFNEKWNAKLGYSKRVQRNNNSELNPIPEREHSETLEQGDPDLLPQFVDLAELGINHSFKKGTFFTTLYFQNIKNPIQRVNSVFNDTILNRVFTNAERARLFGVEFGTNLKPKKWLNVFFGANLYHYKIDGNVNILNQISSVNNSDFVYSLNGNTNFILDKNWSITANVNYTSNKPTAQGKDSSFLSPNLALKKNFSNQKGSFTLQWQNVNFGNMNSNQQRITTFGNNFFTTTNYIYETNVLMLQFSYNFNATTSKNKQPSSEFGEKEF